jgi:hypothetical protein
MDIFSGALVDVNTLGRVEAYVADRDRRSVIGGQPDTLPVGPIVLEYAAVMRRRKFHDERAFPDKASGNKE